MRGGIVFLINEIIKFPAPHTAITERLMMTAGFSCAVTAKAEQTPKICTKMGLFLLNGPRNCFIL